jgi:hypothetical protein
MTAVGIVSRVSPVHLGNNGSDQDQFAPLLDAIKTNLGSNPHEVSADAGYCSTANLRTLSRRRIKGYIATGRQKHGSKSATAKRPAKLGSLLARMTSRLRRAGHRSRYRLRKQVVEPGICISVQSDRTAKRSFYGIVPLLKFKLITVEVEDEQTNG